MATGIEFKHYLGARAGRGRPVRGGPRAPTFSHLPKHLEAQKMISARGPRGPTGHLAASRAGLEPPRCDARFPAGGWVTLAVLRTGGISGVTSDVPSRALSRPRWQALRPRGKMGTNPSQADGPRHPLERRP